MQKAAVFCCSLVRMVWWVSDVPEVWRKIYDGGRPYAEAVLSGLAAKEYQGSKKIVATIGG
jgi:hypothetical protein